MMSHASDPAYFPLNYEDSRRRFYRGIDHVGSVGETGRWPIPGKHDADLFVDFAYWPALEAPQTLFVITSGVHGSEAYAGSAIQQMVMREILPRADRRRNGFLLVHALNPFGFKHHQRTTENGVNLNRNFSVSEKLFDLKTPLSGQMHERFIPREPVSSMKSRLFETLMIQDGVARFDGVSLDEFVKAVSPGQFERPENLEFGGRRLEPQTRFFIGKIRALIPRYQDVIGLDLHTGLGEKNRLHLLTSGAGDDLHPELFAQILHPEKDHDIYRYTPATAEGFYHTHGSLDRVFVDLALPHQRLCAITMEFGTWGHSLEAQLKSWNSFIVDHLGQYYGFATPELEARIKRENFERSYPQDDEWRIAVIDSSRGIFERILARISSQDRT